LSETPAVLTRFTPGLSAPCFSVEFQVAVIFVFRADRLPQCIRRLASMVCLPPVLARRNFQLLRRGLLLAFFHLFLVRQAWSLLQG